jgi:hypothetical protein
MIISRFRTLELVDSDFPCIKSNLLFFSYVFVFLLHVTDASQVAISCHCNKKRLSICLLLSSFFADRKSDMSKVKQEIITNLAIEVNHFTRKGFSDEQAGYWNYY